MNKMAGMTLMILGVICFIVGFVVYSSSSKSVEKSKIAEKSPVSRVEPSRTIERTPGTPAVQSKPIHRVREHSNELERMISMAVADGVLTPNERTLIKELADTKGLNYNVIIRDIENRIASAGVTETEMIDVNKRSGNDFEKFVVQKFDRKYFKIKEWAGDKYVKGRYAETTQHPDLLLEHSYKNETSELAVECKWRSDLYKEGIVIASSEQIKRYKAFEANRKIPVFITLGIGGIASNPEQLYVIPLRAINSNFVPATYLKKFQKQIDKNFYFYSDSQKLM
jgi:hypothetical protein